MHSTEAIIDKVGGFGWYQVRLISIASYLIFMSTTVLLVITFTTAEPPWRCTTNSTSCTLNGTFAPGHKHYEYRCQIPRGDWKFATEGRFDSIVTEFDLVCDTAVYVSHVNSVVFLFGILGKLISSILSDKFGRKIAFPFCMLLSLAGLLSAFAKSYWVFALFRSLLGIGTGGSAVVIFVLVLEYVGSQHRSAVGIGIWYPWILGMAILALLGYLVRSWKLLTILSSAPGLIVFVFWWFTPESLRWLILKGKLKQAKNTLKNAARVNGKHISDDDLAPLAGEHREEKVRMGDIRDLFASRKMAYRTLVSWYCWFVSGIIYFGLTLSTPTIGGNMYLNFFISAVCEGFGMWIGIVGLNKFGRRRTITASFWIAGGAMVTAAVLSYYDDGSEGYLVGKIIMAMMIGRFFITIAFDGIFVHTSELFPTTTRTTAIGTSSAVASIGSMASPYVVYTSRVHPLMPFGIMGANALVSGILFLTLPDTWKKSMPDTVHQSLSVNGAAGNGKQTFDGEIARSKESPSHGVDYKPMAITSI